MFVVVGDQFRAGNAQVHAHLERLVLRLVVGLRFDHHATPGDAAVEGVELVGFFENGRFEMFGQMMIARHDVHRKLHGVLLSALG